MNTLTSRSGRALAAWTLLGLAAYALLPWYFLQQQSLWAALPGVWGGDATASGVVQAALHGRPWLPAGARLPGSVDAACEWSWPRSMWRRRRSTRRFLPGCHSGRRWTKRCPAFPLSASSIG